MFLHCLETSKPRDAACYPLHHPYSSWNFGMMILWSRSALLWQQQV